MPTDFESMMAADMGAIASGEFGASVTFHPVTGSARTINAVIARHPMGPLPGIAVGDVPVMTLTLQNDGTTGVLPSEITGGASIDVPVLKGGTAKNFPLTINDIVAHDAGGVTVNLGGNPG